jgi:hypothetical protein
MTNEEFKKLKEDPTLTLKFFNDKETIDNLYLIYLKLKIAEKCTDQEKEIFNVEYKKGDARFIDIKILQEFREDKKVNLIYSISPKNSRSLFFNSFEQAKDYAIEKINKLVFDPKTELFFQK